MKTVAIIPAGGKGKRMGAEVPKQYVLLGRVPILIHTLRKFQRSASIDEIFVIVPGEDVKKVFGLVQSRYRISKVRQVLAGGGERQDSVRNGIFALKEDHDIVVIHDGVRPFVSDALIEAAVSGARMHGAVSAGIPVKDTVKRVDGCGYVEETLVRDGLWFTQTPQAFRIRIIEEAYRRAYQDNFYGNDDTVLVERMGIRVQMIPGAAMNIKITTQEDLVLAGSLLRSEGRHREKQAGFASTSGKR